MLSERDADWETEAQPLGISVARPPVFLHCGWRTRGTWIWSRFRAMPEVRAYYEPLADTLASLRHAALASFAANSWDSGHDCLDAPYFMEFQPLLTRRQPGVARYHRSFAMDQFFAPPDAALPDLERYLRLLLQTPQQHGEQPVLKFCRSMGRIGWMQRHFPDAMHIAVVRNPLAQFESAHRLFLWHGTAFFLATPLLLLAMHRELPAVRACLNHLAVQVPKLPRGVAPDRALDACATQVRQGDVAGWYRAFLAFWLLCAAAIPTSIDLLIDSDMLSGTAAYRRDCEAKLQALSGRRVCFSDADSATRAGNACAYRPRRADLLAAHRNAEGFLTEQFGGAMYDDARRAWIGRMLAEASWRGLAADDVAVAHPILVPASSDDGAALMAAAHRALRAEQTLATVLASRSWRWTAPLRWLRARGNR